MGDDKNYGPSNFKSFKLQLQLARFHPLHPSPILQVSTLAGADFAAIVHSLQSEGEQVKLASEWSLAVDVLLTEVKASFYILEVTVVVCELSLMSM